MHHRDKRYLAILSVELQAVVHGSKGSICSAAFFSWDKKWSIHGDAAIIEPSHIHSVLIGPSNETFPDADWTAIAAALVPLSQLRRVIVGFSARAHLIQLREHHENVFAGLQDVVEFVCEGARDEDRVECLERIDYGAFRDGTIEGECAWPNVTWMPLD